MHAARRSRMDGWPQIFLGIAWLKRQNSGSDAHAPSSDAMIEIIVLWQLGRRIAERARARGRRGGRYVLLLLALWFFGEFAAGFSAVVLMSAVGDKEADFFPVVGYLSAIAGAAAGAWIALAIASRGPVTPSVELDDDPNLVIEPAETK